MKKIFAFLVVIITFSSGVSAEVCIANKSPMPGILFAACVNQNICNQDPSFWNLQLNKGDIKRFDPHIFRLKVAYSIGGFGWSEIYIDPVPKNGQTVELILQGQDLAVVTTNNTCVKKETPQRLKH